MIGAGLAGDPVFRQRRPERLQPLLQRRLVVARERLRAARVDRLLHFAAQERRRRLEAAIEIDRGNQRLVGVGQQRLLEAAAGLLFAAPENQVFAEAGSAPA